MSNFWRRLSLWIIGITQCSTAPLLAAQVHQPLNTITTTANETTAARAAAHGYDNVQIKVRPLDSRLRLPYCEQPLQGKLSASSQPLGWNSVSISCPVGAAWTIYVRTHVTAMQSVPVLARPMARGAHITEADLKFIEQPLDANVSGMITDADQIVGMELTRRLDAGAIVRVTQLTKPKIVKRGQVVTLQSGVKGLEVRIQGKALADAASGDRVAVSNLSSGKRVEGIVQSDGSVTVY